MENNLTKGPIPKLIRRIAIPASVGFFFNTMYNVVDTFYGGLISTEALAALSISFPIFFIILAMGTGIGTGATALIGNALGEGKNRKAMIYASQAISYSVFLSIILMIVGLLASPSLFRLLGASGDYLAISLQYMNIIFMGTLFFMLNYIFNSILNAQGDTKTFRNFLIAGFFLNLILDPWFMFGGFGIPALGLAGVAWATVLIQFLGVFYMGYKASKTDLICMKCLSLLMPRRRPYAELSQQGFPASINMMTVAIGIFVITFFISDFGKEAVAAYGIATRIEQIALLPTIGLNIATLAIVAQNNGARKYDRIKETLYKSIKYGFIIMAVGTVLVFAFSYQLMGVFTDDAMVVSIGGAYLKIAAFIFFAYVILFVTVSALQGMKKPMYAIWIGIFRQIVAPVIVFYVFAQVLGFGLMGIWWGIFGIVWFSAIVTLVYARYRFRIISPA